MKYSIIFFLLVCFSPLQAQTFGVDRMVSFSDAFPDGTSDFDAISFTAVDSFAFLAFSGYRDGQQEPISAVTFEVTISKDGAVIVGTDPYWAVSYTVSTGEMLLTDIHTGLDGFTKYYFYCWEDGYYITLYEKNGGYNFDLLKSGGYILSVVGCN